MNKGMTIKLTRGRSADAIGRKIQEAVNGGVDSALRSIGENLVRRIKSDILSSKKPWGEGIDPVAAAQQLAAAVDYVIEGTSVIVVFKDGIHQETGLPIPRVAKMREMGTKDVLMDPVITRAKMGLNAEREQHTKNIGDAIVGRLR